MSLATAEAGDGVTVPGSSPTDDDAGVRRASCSSTSSDDEDDFLCVLEDVRSNVSDYAYAVVSCHWHALPLVQPGAARGRPL